MGRQQAEVAERVGRQPRDPSYLLDEVAALLTLTSAVFALVSFVGYHLAPDGPTLAGRVGYGLADVVVQGFGIAAYLLPVFLLAIAASMFRQSREGITSARLVGAPVTLFCAAVLLALFSPQPGDRSVAFAGGWIGGILAELMSQAFGVVGSAILCAALLVLSFVVVARVSLVGALSGALGAVGRTAARLPAAVLPRREDAAPRRRANVKKEGAPAEISEAPIIVLADEAERKTAAARKSRPVKARQEELPFSEEGRYQMPPLDLLDEPDHHGGRIDEEVLRKSSQILESKLADFGIEGRVVEVRPGPVITTFDIEPAPGVKVNRIVSLGDDLSMALRVPGVRILAPVPGKAVVGIEVANPKREEVLIRELLESEAFVSVDSPIALALGKDTAGAAVSGDLGRMPHLLIAGATGSGKSVAINAMVMSILYKASPRDLRFVMIDLKMLELSVYEDIPHLLVPVVTDPKQAVVVLNNIVEQMEDRYRLMKQKAVRNIDGYNRVVDQELAERGAGVIELKDLADGGSTAEEVVQLAEPPRPERLPKIVVIIDELADLMMTMGRKVEEPITRLAQKARAAGIHLIVATQRPSVDVITGLIKANFPARVSFQTTARVDSRTILDSIGAERLLGRGDMLYMPPGTARLQRLHGPLVTEAEIHRVVDYIKKQGSPHYVFSLLEGPEEEGDEGVDDELEDELYDQAVRLVTESRQASISWVQRRLRVGYNRAARMIERMEREGVVTASDGGRPREVLAQRIPSD